MKTKKISLGPIKDPDLWMEVAHELKFEKFKEEYPELDNENGEDELNDLFYQEVVFKKFKYGEYASLEIEIDEDFNIVGGKIL